MHLACPECGAPAEVTPSFANCPACDADVASHYTQAEMIRTAYQRALEHYSMGNEMAALEGIHRGIALLDAPELHLLAALIYRKQGEFKEMREHVAAIPADDILRGEGEWLLRSHQEQLQQGRREEARKRGRAKGAQQTTVASGPSSVASSYPQSTGPRPLATGGGRGPLKKGAPTARRNRLAWAISIVAVVLVAILFTHGVGDTLLTSLRRLRAIPDGLTSVYSSFTQEEPAVETGGQIGSASIEDTPTPSPEESTATPAPTAEPTQPPSPTAPVSARASPDVAATIVATARAQTFDLTAFLNERNRPDLVALGLQASWATGAPPGELIVRGAVTLTSDRIELLELAAEIEGVTSINHNELVVNLPETYLVQAGENLRHIAYRLYGDSARWTELYAANEELVGADPNNVWVGLSLTVPQKEEQQ